MFSNIIITAVMATPVVQATGGFATLDGLLAAAVFERTGCIDTAHNKLPVEYRHKMPATSAATYHVIEVSPRSIIGNLRKTKGFDFSLIARKGNGQDLAQNPFNSDFKDIINHYTLITASSITWLARADADAVRDLVEPLKFIGKRRASGFGEVKHWDIAPTDDDPLLTDDGRPRRPIPKELFEGDTSLPMMDATWKPAYWDVANRECCFCPSISQTFIEREKQ